LLLDLSGQGNYNGPMNIEDIFKNNQKWIADKLAMDADCFKKLSDNQNPEFLYIGCSDSRVVAEEIMGLTAGDTFVHRNIANMVNEKHLNMELTVCIAEELVPSTKEPNPYIHVFLDAGMGNVLAFFEITGEKEMGRDLNTPEWVQHIAFKIADLDALEKAKAKLEELGVDVLGVTDHGIFKSIYFFDPNGHRLELVADVGTAEELEGLKKIGYDMLKEWSVTRKPPKMAEWLHKKEFN